MKVLEKEEPNGTKANSKQVNWQTKANRTTDGQTDIYRLTNRKTNR